MHCSVDYCTPKSLSTIPVLSFSRQDHKKQTSWNALKHSHRRHSISGPFRFNQQLHFVAAIILADLSRN